MKDLEKITKECKRKLEAINIPFNKNVVVKAGKLRTGAWGSYRIYENMIILDPVFTDDRMQTFATENVLIHELLHSCNDCISHSGLWKYYARKVNRTYRYKITRCSDYKPYMSKELLGEFMQRFKYVAQCEGCGTYVTQVRISDFIRNMDNYRCRACKGKFKRIK